MKKLILILLAFFIAFVLKAQGNTNYYFKRLTIADGLSQNTVNSIMQDRNGFIWIGTKDGLNRYDGQTFQVFKYNPDKKSSIGNSFITTMYEDRDGNIWIGTDAGLYIYDPMTENFSDFLVKDQNGNTVKKTVTTICGDSQGTIWIISETQGLFHYIPENSSLTNFKWRESNVRSFDIDHTGTIWITFYDGGLFFSKDDLKTLLAFKTPDGEEPFKNEVLSKTYLGPYNCLYIGSEKAGMRELNLSTGKIRKLHLSDNPDELIFVRDFTLYSDEELWIGTESGIYIYNIKTNSSIHLTSSAFDPYSLSDNAVYSVYADREEGLWIGTFFGGVNYVPKQYTYFEKFYPTVKNKPLQGRRVREICRNTDGNLWVGTEDNGLYLFDPDQKTFRFVTASNDFTNVHGLCMDGDKLWVGTFSKGVKVLSKDGELLKSYMKGDRKNSLNDNSVFTISKSKAGDIYLGTLFGLMKYNRESDDFSEIPELSGVFVYDIKEDSKGNIWLATYVDGAYKYDVNAKKWIHYLHEEGNPDTLPYNKVLSIFEDSKKRIWLTTQGRGFCRYNPEDESLTQYTTNEDAPNDVVMQIIEDDNGLFWISTNNGLVKLNPQTKETRIYTTADGLLSNQFNYKSGYKDDKGNIYMGSIDGLISFNPSSFRENVNVPPIVITDFLLFNEKVIVGESDSPLKKSITFSDKIELLPSQNSFSLRVAALGYHGVKINELEYKLEGVDNEWMKMTESSLVTYSNINHGHYIFKVRNNSKSTTGNVNEVQLSIRVLPPFYLSIWAYILYFILVVFTIIGIIMYVRKRNEYRQRKLINNFNRQKERELYDAKIEFFTNVAHEIRTPLTLIKGPLDNIIERGSVDKETKVDLGIMSKNTSRLLDLTNQLLDFRKMETQETKMNIVECNVSEILRDISLRFVPLEKQNRLNFTLNIPDTDFYAHVDKEAFTKILSNLFNNAIKYSETYVRVFLEIGKEDNVFRVRFINDGNIIPENMREEIFKPFVRINGQTQKTTIGTGIGLALARTLTELHGGCLFVDDNADANNFTLMLPTYHEDVIKLIPQDSFDKDLLIAEHSARVDDTRPVILVVEDNPEMRLFISRVLLEQYNVINSTNGIEALKMLDNNMVNLIVSDIMMPQMDGFELCKAIKSDLSYSHIPVILLTAKTNLQSKIEGMEVGADAYIEKPFSNNYLLACIANQLQNREKVREAFTKSPFVSSHTMAITQPDEEFLDKLNETIQSNMSNPNFSIDDMAEMFFMSRSSFYRKIRGIVGVSPNELLRVERLKKAARLLNEGSAQVNEVCYMVGFNSPSYFAKCFFKQFDMLPKDYAQVN
jgi:Signal transduction histidine kinase